MGIITQGKTLWRALFTRTQRRVLGLLFGHPGRSFYANEVVRLAGVGTGSVQRELKRLAEAGLLTVRRVGNQVHYQANPACPLYPELRSMVVKTFAVVERLRGVVQAIAPELELALVYGSAADPAEPLPGEIDLLLVADEIDEERARAALDETEREIGRTIRLLLVTSDTFHYSRNNPATGLGKALAGPRIVLAGETG